MNILVEIQQKSENMTSSEKVIAEYLLDHASDAIPMSAQKLAETLHVSTASLVRFSRSLGLSGFTELKQRLSAALTEIPGTDILREVEQGDSVKQIKSKIQVRIKHMTDETGQLLDDAEVVRAANMIAESKTVFVFGIGASGLVAQDVLQKFTRIGKSVFNVMDVHIFVTAIAALHEHSCLILISNSGETSDILRVAQVANSFKMPILAITGKNNSTLARHTDVLLNSVTGESRPFRTAATVSLMAQLYVVDILFYRYVATNFHQSMDGIKRSRKIIENIEPKRNTHKH